MISAIQRYEWYYINHLLRFVEADVKRCSGSAESVIALVALLLGCEDIYMVVRGRTGQLYAYSSLAIS